MPRTRWIAAAMSALALVTAAADAQDVIATDRPGLGSSPLTVPRGAVQLELGLPALAQDAESGVDIRTINFPALVRIGVAERVELRVGSPMYHIVRTESAGNSVTERGAGGLELGAKLGLRSATVSGPDMAVIASALLPVGDEQFAGDRTTWVLTGLAGWSLPGGWSLTNVVGATIAPEDEDDWVTSGALAAVFARSLGDAVGGFLEAGWFPVADGADPVYAGGGITVLLTPMLQLDAFVDRALGSAGADWLFGAGASVRF